MTRPKLKEKATITSSMNFSTGSTAARLLETRIEKNIVSYAMVIAAMETDGQPKKIADYIADLGL